MDRMRVLIAALLECDEFSSAVWPTGLWGKCATLGASMDLRPQLL